jgi:hypothetical protein
MWHMNILFVLDGVKCFRKPGFELSWLLNLVVQILVGFDHLVDAVKLPVVTLLNVLYSVLDHCVDLSCQISLNRALRFHFTLMFLDLHVYTPHQALLMNVERNVDFYLLCRLKHHLFIFCQFKNVF